MYTYLKIHVQVTKGSYLITLAESGLTVT